MKKKLLAAVVIALTLLPLLPLNAQKVLGYWPSYRTGIHTINFNHYTDIVYAFLNPSSNGSLNFNDGHFNQSEFNNLVSQCKSNGVKAHISIGGAGLSTNIATVAASSSARATFISQIVSFVAGKHANNSVPLAGLDIDWEFPTSWSDKKNHLTLVKELKVALNNQESSDGNKYELAIAVGGSTPGMPKAQSAYHSAYFERDVINHVDYVYIMNYDLSVLGYPNNHHSSYQACVDAFTYYKNTLGFPASKLLMGIPFYGRNSATAVEWKNIANATNFNSSTGVGGGYTFNSKPVIDQKVAYLCANGAGGALVWEISQDASSASLSLSKALSDAFAANNCATTNGGGGGVITTGDCVSATSFSDEYDEKFAPSDGNISLGYWGESGGVYSYTRAGAGDLDVKVTQAKNGWSPMGFSLTDPNKTMSVDVSSSNEIQVSLTNEGPTGIEVYFSLISNNTSGASAQLVTATGNGVLFGGIVAAGGTMTRTFDLNGATKHKWVGAGGPCSNGTMSGDYCLTNTGFDSKKLTGIEFSINGQGASVGGAWAQPAINNHPVKIHYIRGGSSDCVGTNSVEDVAEQLLALYPNPATDVLNVKYNSANSATLMLSDVNGKILYNGIAGGDAGLVTINVADYKSGMYFVKLTNDAGTTVSKVIVR